MTRSKIELGIEGHLAHVCRERDLFRALLALGNTEQLETALRQALSLLVDVSQASRGYLELHDEGAGGRARLSIAAGCTGQQIEAIRSWFSHGAIAETLATGKTVGVGSVLCAPIGSVPPLGVVYLQDRSDAGPFCREDRQHVEMFARQVAGLADQLLLRNRDAGEADPTLEFRSVLRVDTLIGRSPALAHVLRHVTLVAPLDVSVLITGPSGTGKTQLARVIHDNGPRAANPFVELNCAALPETLIESELFGAMPGAHSTAARRVEGKVAAAETGTLFLDEVAELPLPAQSKLLQILHSKEYYPLGAPRPVRADIRIIAASNSDLRKAVAERTFREDLFYRLQVLPLRMPSLAERREDIPDLLRFFCARARKRHQLSELRISPVAIKTAEAAEWPGNLRELAHAVEAAAIRAASQGVLTIERSHLFPDMGVSANVPYGPLTFQQATRAFQARLLERTLNENGWNIVEVANRLDLARSHIYNLVRVHGLKREPR